MRYFQGCTPPKYNMEPENDGFQKESPFPGTSFQVPCQILGVYLFSLDVFFFRGIYFIT